MYTIEATDGCRVQCKKLKNCSEMEAREKMMDLFEDDYLGLDYYLYDPEGNEIMCLEQD